MISLINATALHIPLESASIQTCVTSPPYFAQRIYKALPTDWPEVSYKPMLGCAYTTIQKMNCVLGNEKFIDEYIGHMLLIFDEVHRVLRDDGTVWLNIGDKHVDKDIMGTPWRLALALQARGWCLRSDIIWSKLSCMPESAKDRPTTSHEYIFLLSKQDAYFCDMEAIKEKALTEWSIGKNQRIKRVKATGGAVSGGTGDKVSSGKYRNKRTVWEIGTSSYHGDHSATYPPELVEPCIVAGTSRAGACPYCGKAWYAAGKGEEDRTWLPGCECENNNPVPCRVLDPFVGSGTTVAVAHNNNCHGIGTDVSGSYLIEEARVRLQLDALDNWSKGKKVNSKFDGLPLFENMKIAEKE